MRSVLNEIITLRGGKRPVIDYRNTNRYCVIVSEDNGTKTAYCFGTPIYNRKTRKLVDLRFYHNNGVYCAHGSDSEITVGDGICMENDGGFCKVRFPGEISIRAGTRCGTAAITPTLNGTLIKVPCMADQPYEVRLLSGQPFMEIRANDRCFSLMREPFKPFVTVSCIGVFDGAYQTVAPCSLSYQRNNDQEFSLTLHHGSPHGSTLLFEINMHENKLFQDTTVESLHPDVNNAFGGTAFIGQTTTYGEQWIYSRPDFSRLPELFDKQIQNAILHMPSFGGNCALSASGLTARFCSFGSNWENKVQEAEEITDAVSTGGYLSFNVTRFITDRTRFLKPFDGFILKPKGRGNGFSAIFTGDSNFAPQILEINFR